MNLSRTVYDGKDGAAHSSWFDGTSTDLLARWCGIPRKCNVALAPYKQQKPLLCPTYRTVYNAINASHLSQTVLNF